MTTLKETVKQKIKSHFDLMLALQSLFRRDKQTLIKWIDYDNPKLTNLDALNLISEKLEISSDELIEP